MRHPWEFTIVFKVSALKLGVIRLMHGMVGASQQGLICWPMERDDVLILASLPKQHFPTVHPCGTPQEAECPGTCLL